MNIIFNELRRPAYTPFVIKYYYFVVPILYSFV